jgi:hypothetical protein
MVLSLSGVTGVVSIDPFHFPFRWHVIIQSCFPTIDNLAETDSILLAHK